MWLDGDDVSVCRQPIKLLFLCSREQIRLVENRLDASDRAWLHERPLSELEGKWVQIFDPFFIHVLRQLNIIDSMFTERGALFKLRKEQQEYKSIIHRNLLFTSVMGLYGTV
jgi:hypothetical protein